MMRRLAFAVVAASAVFAGIAAEKKAADGTWDSRNGIANSLKAFKDNRAGYQYVFPVGDFSLAAKRFNHAKRMRENILKRFGGNPILRGYDIKDSWYSQYSPGGRFTSGHLLVLDLAYAIKPFDENPGKAEVELEVLLRQTKRFNPISCRILVYPADGKLVAEYKKGAVPELVKRAERIAAHYGIASVDLAKAEAAGIDQGKTIDDFMASLLENSVPASYGREKDPPKLNAAVNDNCRVISYDDGAVRKKGDWKFGNASPVKDFLHVLSCERAGCELEMEFRGTEVGISDVTSKDGVAWEWSVDGGKWNRVEPEDAGEGKVKVRHIPLACGLEYDDAQGTKQQKTDRHVIRLRTASAGRANFYGFLLNGSVADEGFSSRTSIEYLDKIYSGMKKIDYNPPKDRFANIPGTLKKLNEGPELRIVMLGDSIVNDTASSNYELLLMRRYPKCKVTKIRSVRGSTGCWYYAKENRVREWVLNHRPDLVIIGGVSNRDDADSVRSVVKQLKAEKPDIDIMLVTPVFGSKDNVYNRDWTYEIDPSKYLFRAQLRDIAKEEKCAFFDMTAEWKKYVNESGFDVGWFMRDPVHANARGSQILGRLLEIWFDDKK